MIQRHLLINSFFEVRMSGIDFPSFFQLDQWKKIRIITINLIGRSENKYRFRAVISAQFQHVQCSGSVHSEICQWLFCSPIMRRLCSRMNNQFNVFTVFLKNGFKSGIITNVNIVMTVIAVFLFQFQYVPLR
ncbi:hypothetical protein D3C80_1536580 [compost metagenome]